ncbi:HSP20-like chaperone [Purpureocillium lilacinum]|uniref:HSP20-like chaperone n=1 Tax=Purpureocillium lilacinum TaxID=33203 RepID=A0A179HMR0_PURLI|nr:HSP20-like chaperone [Purpureocillium lilacinum]OAQ90831.1 HSP20-like chaperone [Purpureocillium lilacinum]
MASQDQNRANVPFWDFIQSFDPNRAAAAAPGQGVDHHDGNPPPFPPFMAGFGFPWGTGPRGHHHGGHGPHPPPPPPPPGHHGPPHPHHPPPPPPPGSGWDSDWDFEWGPWSHDDEGQWPWGRRGGRHNHRHHGRGRGHPGRGRRHEGNTEGDAQQQDDAAAAPIDVDATTATAERAAPDEKATGSPDTMDQDFPDPAEVTPDEDEASPPPYGGPGGPSHGRRGHGRCRRGGGFGRGAWGRDHPWGCRRGGGRHHGAWGGVGGSAPFDFQGMMRGVMGHPFFQNVREQAQRYYTGAGADSNNMNNNGDESSSSSFSPPVDVFNTTVAYVVHVALPGARKEDLGVTWNPDRGTLDIAGVVHRPGDEFFLETLASAERRVGLFERSVALPPAAAAGDSNNAHREEAVVDADNITARMEDGVLVVVVPKIEKEWTEIRKVDIE